MDYLYENLGDERFQEFCSSLIAKEFPNSQSFPVGQPDGGRDTISYNVTNIKKEFIVFQVKYVKNANTISDLHQWLKGIIAKEAPKIDKLIPKGAKQFYLITNVKGTAHLDSGSIDKVNRILEESISIPSVCYWREDLSRLIEKDPIFKWSFPEILNGQDVLNSILFSNINENKEKRESIIKAYLIDQYQMDNEVKFRQIDLQNKLFDLFTDVPIHIKKFNNKNKYIKNIISSFDRSNKLIMNFQDAYMVEEQHSIGAANFILHPEIQNNISKILLEGGPGQGKSTISQFVCQVHRAKLLNKTNDLEILPKNLQNIPIRLPFKIDLRHIASWVENKNPYQSRLGEEYFKSIWKNSLESFLIGHMVYHSQIDDFTTTDLMAILRVSSTLFVFDGFDEIADFKIRESVIDFINKGLNRIQENAKSIQVLITSRPAAFSDTIGFSTESYPHFELTDITEKIIKEYVEKWIKASRLESREASEIKRLVDEKLKMPHLRDLAKSPMQLAIFISLLRTRGESLPNKRTALYDSYIDLFFNRESEKNTVIRDNRDLIIDIHQYLAWILHSEAEMLKNTGSISIEDLKIRLKEYLEKEGHKTDITDQLFHVLEERVCALVSRVQGTYEFEVQPLREYFCARYLYNTSPYSPAGAEKPGTKPERFNAIAGNFYWHNVVRFFAGCFDKGELPMLIQQLKELQEDKYLKYTNYPRLIISQILSDWVFTQYPILLKDVIKMIVDGVNIGHIINQGENPINNEPIILPIQCGRNELVNECFEELKKFPHNDYAFELIGILNNNPYKKEEHWLSNINGLSEEKLTQWLEYAYRLGIIYKLEKTILVDTLNVMNENTKFKRLFFLIDGNRMDIIDNDLNIKGFVLKGILNNNIPLIYRRSNEYPLQFLSILLNPFIWDKIQSTKDNNLSILSLVNMTFGNFDHNEKQIKSSADFVIQDSVDEKIKNYFNEIEQILDQDFTKWQANIELWDLLIERGILHFSHHWKFKMLAVMSAGIKVKSEIFEEFNDLNDNKKSLCKRVKFARHKSGNHKYWEDLLKINKDLCFVLLIFLTWATVKTIIKLLRKIDNIVKNLIEEDYILLKKALQSTADRSTFTQTQTKEIIQILSKSKCTNELKFLLSLRFLQKFRDAFISENIDIINLKLADVSSLTMRYLIKNYFQDTSNREILYQIKKSYSQNFKDNDSYLFYHFRRINVSCDIPISIAKEIMKEPRKYPRIIATVAEKSCRINANKHLIPVGRIAQEEKWFN